MTNNIIKEIKYIRKNNITGYYRCKVFYSDGTTRELAYHRALIEQHLNRKLSKDEIIEFINGDRSNFDLSNLRLTTRTKAKKGIRAPTRLQEQIIELVKENKTYDEISKQLNCGKGTISYYVRKANIDPAYKKTKSIDDFNWNKIQKYYNQGYNIKECCQIFNFSRSTWEKAVSLGYIVPQEKQKIPSNDEVLCKDSLYRTNVAKRKILRNNLLPYKCNICGLDKWMGKEITLSLDHINGINNDHRLENLRFLCPNCHSQTETFCGKNFKGKNQKLSKEEVIQIKKELEYDKSILSLCKKYNVSYNTITSIRDGKTHKNINL